MRNNYIKKTLKNGVKLYLYIDSNMRRCYVDYAVDYGLSGKWFDFYYENKHVVVPCGAAHFLEHMLGEHSKYGNIYNYFSNKRYTYNAITNRFVTHFFFCGVEDIKESLKKLINAIDDPVFNKDDVEETKKAIIEETKRGLNNKYGICDAIIYRNLYKDLNLYDESLCAIGNEETTNKLTYDILKTCYDAFYYDENKSLLIAGNFDEEEMTNYVESIYEKLKAHPKKVKEYIYPNLDKMKTKEEIYYMSTSDDLLSIGFKEKMNGFSKKEIVLFLRFLCSRKFTAESEFNKRLKKDNIISFYEGLSHSFACEDYYHFIVQFSAKNSKKCIEEVLKEIKIDNLSKEEFELFKRALISKEAGKIDDKYLVFNDFHYDRPYTEDFDEIDYFKTIEYDRFLEFYQSLDFKNYTIAIIRDDSKQE